jgi:hypothetical protein
MYCAPGIGVESLSYLLPLRSAVPVSAELLDYLHGLVTCDQLDEVMVVDGSPAGVFADFDRRCAGAVRHVAVDRDFAHLANGKVAGVLTGLRLTSAPWVVIADDDVRYDRDGLAGVRRALGNAAVVRPQNYFEPLPWHACLDTGRILINRVTGGDWPGTLALRRAALEQAGGYDGNVLFENLELVRTVRASGGREVCPLDLFVRRLPPPTHHFWSQRVRQAYDEFARPARLLTWLAVLPAAAVLVYRMRWYGLAVALAAPIMVAEAGRRAGHGTRVFPAVAAIAAPLWVLERAVCAWVAVASRVVRGGVRYRGRVLRNAATPYRVLVRRHGPGARARVRQGSPAGAGGLAPRT